VAKYDHTERKEIPGRLRILLLAIALGVGGLLAVAAWLKPSPLHYGTHQQLGLPPCTFLYLFGIPCPTCGMTTAWVHLVHGEILNAIRANCGGALLAVLAVLAVPWLVISALCARWFLWKPNGMVVGCVSTLIIIIMLVQWGLRLLGV
jgi:hypothetical protein